MEKLSTHFSVWEFERSQTAKRLGIANKMEEEHKENAKALCENVLEPLRKHLAMPIKISSGFRSIELNKAIGSKSARSQHCKGEAVDIDMDGYYQTSNAEVFRWLLNNTDFDQIIAEYPNNGNPEWIHVSYSKNKEKQRNEILVAKRQNNNTIYIPYKSEEDLK